MFTTLSFSSRTFYANGNGLEFEGKGHGFGPPSILGEQKRSTRDDNHVKAEVEITYETSYFEITQ